MIPHERLDALRSRLVDLLAEDAHNVDRLLSQLQALSHETGLDVHAAALLILTRLTFREDEARRHWEAIVGHREKMGETLGRDVGLRVALMDYFVNENRNLLRPTLIDLEMVEAAERETPNDSLTGLLADLPFRTAVQKECRRARRYTQKMSVVVFDIDDFEEVNLRNGRALGDRLLREAAILVSNKIRDIDIAGRPGEDELTVLLPETDGNGALLVAERFRREFESYFARRECQGRPVQLKISAGVASYPADATSAHELLERAAQALYSAKAGGKNMVQRYQPERRRFLRLELEPGRFEIEVLSPREAGRGTLRDLSHSGLLFTGPEPLEVGERIEIRVTGGQEERGHPPLSARGQVVRLEELPIQFPVPAETEEAGDRYEIGMAFDLGSLGGGDDLLEFLEWTRRNVVGTTT
ncbi:MAG: diguanylate cyclase [Acidobacteriota bacterium]|nr:diguanylate cyclase [Acidobacteriota bacterium]